MGMSQQFKAKRFSVPEMVKKNAPFQIKIMHSSFVSPSFVLMFSREKRRSDNVQTNADRWFTTPQCGFEPRLVVEPIGNRGSSRDPWEIPSYRELFFIFFPFSRLDEECAASCCCCNSSSRSGKPLRRARARSRSCKHDSRCFIRRCLHPIDVGGGRPRPARNLLFLLITKQDRSREN